MQALPNSVPEIFSKPMLEGMEWHERLNLALKAKNWTVADLARALGSDGDDEVLNRLYKYTTGKVRNPRGDWMERIASAVGVTVAYLRFGMAEVPKGLVQEVVLGPDLAGAKEGQPVAVLGVSVGGSEFDDKDRTPDFWMNGETVNFVARPKGLANAKDVFSVYVRGESMWPRYEENDLVFLQKTAPAIGDDVVIELKPKSEGEESATFIKRLVRRRGSYITVRQFNPDKELDFDLKEIKNLFRVIPTKEWVG